MSTNPVLCAVDISNEDRDVKALKQAAAMAAQSGSQLDVITVVPDFGMSVVGSFFDQSHHQQAVQEAQSRLSELTQRVLGAEASTKVRHLVATGNVYEEILKAALVDDTSLIVIGAHKPDFNDYLLGPNAARVVRHSSCSVYVVR